MKFRGKMTSVISIRQFAQLIHMLSKCSTDLVIRVADDRLKFITCKKYDENATKTKGPAGEAYCELPKVPYFDEYAMEGISREDNEIYLEIPTDSLAGVLNTFRTSSTVSSLKIKLTKKDVPCITIEIERSTGAGQTCIHDIPVQMIKREFWDEYKEPDLPEFEVSIEMPELRWIQRSLERMKNLSKKLTISASKLGQLYLSIDTISVQSTVKFKDLLRVLDLGDDNEDNANQDQDQDTIYNVEVDMKSILPLIPQESVKPTRFILSLVHEHCVHMFFVYGEITLQYFLPGSAGG